MYEVNMRFCLLMTICLWMVAVSANEDMIVVKGTSKLTPIAKAQRQIHQNAIEQTALKVIRDLLGSERYADNQKLINDTVLSKKDRFILFSKTSKPTVKDGITYMSVTLKLSLPDLKTILRNVGLLKLQSEPITVLPLFVVSDELLKVTYRWWLDSDSKSKELQSVKTHFLEWMKVFQEIFSTKGFLFIDPIKKKSAQLVPKKFQKKVLQNKDLKLLGDHAGVQILLIGHIRLYQAPLKQSVSNFHQNVTEIKLSALHSASGKIISEVKKQLQGSPYTQEQESKALVANGPYNKIIKDLALQTLTAWQQGNFRLQRKRLILLGQLNFQQIEAFKQAIQMQISSIRKLRERLLKKNEIIFEIESDMQQQSLADKISQMDFDHFRLTDFEISRNDILFRIN